MCDVTSPDSGFGGVPIVPTGLNSTESAAMLLGGHWALNYEQERQEQNRPEAATLRAQIAREQWEDYKTRFQPIENVLLGYANNPEEFKDRNREAALGKVGDVYNRAPDQIERRMESYGLQVGAPERQRIQQKTDYQRGLATVQAANQSQRLSEDQLKGIIGGGLFVGNRQATTNQRPQVGYGG